MVGTKYYEIHSRDSKKVDWKKENHFAEKKSAEIYAKDKSLENKNRVYLIREIDTKNSVNYFEGKKLK